MLSAARLHLVAMESAYAKQPSEVLAHFGVTMEKGLTAQAVEEQRAKFGRNGTSGGL